MLYNVDTFGVDVQHSKGKLYKHIVHSCGHLTNDSFSFIFLKNIKLNLNMKFNIV